MSRDVLHVVEDRAADVRRGNDLVERQQRITRLYRLDRKCVKACAAQLAGNQRIV